MIVLKPTSLTDSFCGPACLESLFLFYGVKMSQKQLGELCHTTIKDGTKPEDMVSGLQKLGFKVKAKNYGTWEEIKKIVDSGIPVLVDWWSDYGSPADGHYSVVYRMTNKSIYMMDPELGGFRRMTKSKFMHQWYDFYMNGKKNTRWYMFVASAPK